jgi:hypothetical protein
MGCLSGSDSPVLSCKILDYTRGREPEHERIQKVDTNISIGNNAIYRIN